MVRVCRAECAYDNTRTEPFRLLKLLIRGDGVNISTVEEGLCAARVFCTTSFALCAKCPYCVMLSMQSFRQGKRSLTNGCWLNVCVDMFPLRFTHQIISRARTLETRLNARRAPPSPSLAQSSTTTVERTCECGSSEASTSPLPGV